MKLDVNGDIAVNGNIAAKYQDVAEWVPTTAGALAPGTVLSVDPAAENHVCPAAAPYDTRVAGVVSARPGLLLGEVGADKVKVTHTGRVPVKVDAAYGPIQVGDLLVSSPPRLRHALDPGGTRRHPAPPPRHRPGQGPAGPAHRSRGDPSALDAAVSEAVARAPA